MYRITWLGVGSVIATALIAGGAAYAVGSSGPTNPKGTPGEFIPHPTQVVRDTDNTVKTIAPCRAVDTRHGGGVIATGSTRTFSITGTNLSAQGGSATGCAVPTYAGAALLNVNVTGTTGAGYVSVFPAAPKPATSTVNFTGKGQTIANGATIALSPTGSVEVYAARGTQVIIDVTGYTVQPAAFSLSSGPAATVYAKTPRVGSATRFGAGIFKVAVDGVSSACWVSATPEYYGGTASAYTDAQGVYLRTYDATGAPADLSDYVDVIVHC